MRTIELVTTELHQDNKPFRDDLISNFQIIQTELNNLEIDLSKFIANEGTSNQSATEFKSQLTGLTSRINRIVLGTDDEAIRLVVTNILKEQGVIK